VEAAHSQQPPDDARNVGAEVATVHVGFVDNNVPEVPQKRPPALHLSMVRKDAHVHHVRVGEDQIARLDDRVPLLVPCVSIQHTTPDGLFQGRVQLQEFL
jgi:hypothetical protein